MNEFPVSHPHLSDEINRNIQNSVIAGGVFIENVPNGRGLVVQTQNTRYVLRKDAAGTWTISGHPRYCPSAVPCHISGSTWGGSMLKIGWIGRGMHMEFHVDGHRGAITTSEIREVVEIP